LAEFQLPRKSRLSFMLQSRVLNQFLSFVTHCCINHLVRSLVMIFDRLIFFFFSGDVDAGLGRPRQASPLSTFEDAVLPGLAFTF
jgi:hypothetical protein